jgi:hypothetical protein
MDGRTCALTAWEEKSRPLEVRPIVYAVISWVASQRDRIIKMVREGRNGPGPRAYSPNAVGLAEMVRKRPKGSWGSYLRRKIRYLDRFQIVTISHNDSI